GRRGCLRRADRLQPQDLGQAQARQRTHPQKPPAIDSVTIGGKHGMTSFQTNLEPRMTRIRADKYERGELAHPRVSALSAVKNFLGSRGQWCTIHFTNRNSYEFNSVHKKSSAASRGGDEANSLRAIALCRSVGYRPIPARHNSSTIFS